MLKRAAALIAFLCLLFLVLLRGMGLELSYFVLMPMLSVPVLILMECFPRFWGLSLCGIIVLHLFYAYSHPSVEAACLGVLFMIIIAGCYLYRIHWRRVLERETQLTEHSLRELNQLKQKHQSRLDSLHHLEKQVAGLLGLFEIARDFNDALSYEAIQDLMIKRVMPDLPFLRLRIFLFNAGAEDPQGKCVILAMSDDGYQPPFAHELTDADIARIENIRLTKKFYQIGTDLLFPLLVDGEMAAAMFIDGIQPDDLPKFEVLSAYMALQVRKIKLYETVKELSIRDGLTGVFVRRHFNERFDEELKRSIKYGLPLAVLMLDIDLFKRYNDDHGHLAGDATLKQVAQLLCESLRKVDIVARYGGEEFIVVIPDAKKTGADEVAERIRSSIARYQFKVFNEQTRVTVSIGIALFPDDVTDIQTATDAAHLAFELVQRADKALYRAKEEGRNRVVFYQDL